MPDYRRAFEPGGTFFSTLVTEGRAPILCTELARSLLHDCIAECARTRPFVLEGMVLLPDHVHAMLTLPPGDTDFSTRWSFIKARFSHEWIAHGGVEQRRTGSRVANRRRGVWQRRFWEHVIRDRHDRAIHWDYMHYNPVKHGLATCPHGWPYSTFGKWVGRCAYEADWQCTCDGRSSTAPSWANLDLRAIEMGE